MHRCARRIAVAALGAATVFGAVACETDSGGSPADESPADDNGGDGGLY